MNPRQRRGVLFVVISGLLAVVVFAAVAVFVSSVNSKVGDVVTVYRAGGPIPAYGELTADSIVADEIPRRWVADDAVLATSDLIGRRVAFNVAKGTLISSDMLVPPSDLAPNEREIAIDVDSVTGIADRVRPGDLVDIYAVFADVPGLPKQVRVLVRDVRVVSVRGSQVRVDEESARGQESVVPVTLALAPDDALAVTYAAAFAAEVRLVGLPAGATGDRSGEIGDFDAGNLGGQAIPEGSNG
ncbi:Flp pilus assembly protein CpaB [Xylanimonas allomyrinae]|uniref:Flp pilus assembly protein CpaB n=1 Tax=Xylanimonas allomyrinae TaxID=2509459 RepID=A0A4P6ENS8_9MICO|nr:Flp pilus assembly protein CpaB [Xylanimonas allomyrinae]QAY64374.1 Flp pilus assembly protein CpaB [Xylanimonas allomyrinae]